MKKNFLFFFVFLSFAMQGEALLPPLYQTSAEIKSMMEDPELGQKLSSGEMIAKIEKNQSGYEITTNKHQVQVYIEYEKDQKPGPAKFKFIFGDPLSIQKN